jgi:hypothetical protein
MPGTHQNASAEGVVLTHTLYGSPVASPQGFERNGGDIQPAGLHSTAPYRPPKRREKDNPTKPLCEYEGGCKAFAMKAVPYCAGHARKLGVAPWLQEETVDDDDR